MTKADKGLILVLMLCSILLLFPLFNAKNSAHIASVKVKNKEVLSIDLNKDETYTVKGTNGNIQIEVKDKKIRVSQENSKNHTCSKQGFVSDVNVPIVCLPNETIVTIEGDNEEEDVLIQ